MMPYDVPVTQPGSAVHQKTSPGRRSRAYAEVAWWATTAWWTCTAPLGFPVVPLVKCSSAMSSGSVGGISYSGDAAAISSSSPQVLTSPEPSTIRTCSRSGRSARSLATFRR